MVGLDTMATPPPIAELKHAKALPPAYLKTLDITPSVDARAALTRRANFYLTSVRPISALVSP